MPKKSTITQAKYDAANTTRVSLKFNNNTDAAILARLEQAKAAGGIQGYIKDLIRRDIG